jgi:hypothetical protein
MQIAEAYYTVVELAAALGVKKINELEGCWERAVDEQWFVAFNGHKEPMKVSRGATLPPYEIYIEFNGWPAGVIGPDGGIIAAGDAANEKTFIAALKAAIEQARPN